MEKIDVYIQTEYIPLNKLLKKEGIISTGGEMKHFIVNNTVLYNGEPESRLRKKIFNQDIVMINQEVIIQVHNDN